MKDSTADSMDDLKDAGKVKLKYLAKAVAGMWTIAVVCLIIRK